MPSNLRSNSQSGPLKRSWVSVAAIGSSQSGMRVAVVIRYVAPSHVRRVHLQWPSHVRRVRPPSVAFTRTRVHLQPSHVRRVHLQVDRYVGTTVKRTSWPIQSRSSTPGTRFAPSPHDITSTRRQSAAARLTR